MCAKTGSHISFPYLRYVNLTGNGSYDILEVKGGEMNDSMQSVVNGFMIGLLIVILVLVVRMSG